MVRLILVAALVVLFLILASPLLLFEALLAKRNPALRDVQSRKIIQAVFRLILFVAGTELVVEGRELIPTDRAVLFVGNHRSYFDIVTSYTQMQRTTGFVAKAEMEKIPLLRGWMRQISCLFLDRKDVRAGLKTILEAIAQVKSGRSVFIFPEGTRNTSKRPEELMDFHEGSLKIAEKARCPVVPVAIYGSDHVFERHLPWICRAKVVIRFGTPLDMQALPEAYRRKPGLYVRAKIEELLQAVEAEHPEIRYE